MTSKLGFYLHSSQDRYGLYDLFERIRPSVIMIHLESKDDILLTQSWHVCGLSSIGAGRPE